MKQLIKLFKFFLLVLGTLLFTPALMGGPFIRTLYKQSSPVVYFPLILAISLPFFLPFPPVGGFFFSLMVCVGVQTAMEQRGVRFWTASSVSLVLGILSWTLITQLWLIEMQMTWGQMFISAAEHFVSQMQTVPSMKDMKLDPTDFIHQAPGAIISFFVIYLGFSIALERRTHQIFGFIYERRAAQIRPLEFKVPDFMVWVTLFSALLSMVGPSEITKLLGQNLLTVCFATYFFQGLAITEVFLIFVRAGPFLKFFTYFALVGQLILVISAIGFVDFWLDLRKKMRLRIQRIPQK